MSCHFLLQGSSWPRDWTWISWSSQTAGRFFTAKPPGKPLLETRPLYIICKYFLPYCQLSFHLDSVLCCTKIFNFMKSVHFVFFFFHFFFYVCAFGDIIENPLPNPRSWRFTPVFPSESFIVLGLWSILSKFLNIGWGRDLPNFILFLVEILS